MQKLQPKAIIDYNLLNHVCHDTRSPFNGLIGFSELLALNIHSITDDKKEEYANTIYNLAEKTQLSTHLLIAWIKLISGNFIPNNAIVSLQQIVAKAIQYNESEIQFKQIHLSAQIIDVEIEADSLYLPIAIGILLSMFFKNLPSGSTIQIEGSHPIIYITAVTENQTIKSLVQFFHEESNEQDQHNYTVWVAKQILAAQSALRVDLVIL